MAKLSDIAKVNIALETASIGKASFGIPMIAAKLGSQFTDRVYTFNDANEAQDLLGADGKTHLPTPLLNAIKKAFSQTPRIEKLIVAKLLEVTTHVVVVGANAFDPNNVTTNGQPGAGIDFKFQLDGIDIIYTTVGATETRTEVLAGLLDKATKSSIAQNYTFTTDPATFTLTVKPNDVNVPTAAVGGTNTTLTSPSIVAGTAGNEYAEQLSDIQGIDDTWYGFTVLDLEDADIGKVAAWAESADPNVQFWATSDTPGIWTDAPGQAADVLTDLKTGQYLRTVFTPSKFADQYEHLAAMARFYVGEPGSIIAGLKTLVGVTKLSKFTPQQTKNVLAKNGNTYEQYASNVYLFNPGKAVSGEWADVVRDRDWLVNYIQTSMASAMIRAPKIPYTNPGITSLVNILQGCLRYAQQQGVIAPDQIDSLGNTVPGFVIVAPNALDVPFADKADRILKIKFTALLAGAIQIVQIDGVLTYSYNGV